MYNLDSTMLRASRNMVIQEKLEDKSSDYRAGFFDGMRLQYDFLAELLGPKIEALKEEVKEISQRDS